MQGRFCLVVFIVHLLCETLASYCIHALARCWIVVSHEKSESALADTNDMFFLIIRRAPRADMRRKSDSWTITLASRLRKPSTVGYCTLCHHHSPAALYLDAPGKRTPCVQIKWLASLSMSVFHSKGYTLITTRVTAFYHFVAYFLPLRSVMDKNERDAYRSHSEISLVRSHFFDSTE